MIWQKLYLQSIAVARCQSMRRFLPEHSKIHSATARNSVALQLTEFYHLRPRVKWIFQAQCHRPPQASCSPLSEDRLPTARCHRRTGSTQTARWHFQGKGHRRSCHSLKQRSLVSLSRRDPDRPPVGRCGWRSPRRSRSAGCHSGSALGKD